MNMKKEIYTYHANACIRWENESNNRKLGFDDDTCICVVFLAYENEWAYESFTRAEITIGFETAEDAMAKATEELFEDTLFPADDADIDADTVDELLEDILHDAARDELLLDLMGWD
jgi:hypothetical protein